MTSLAVNYGWTPELIAKDKALKAKYGNSAHITPTKTYAYPKNAQKLERTPENETFNKQSEQKYSKIKTFLALATAGILTVILTKKAEPQIGKILQKLKDKSPIKGKTTSQGFTVTYGEGFKTKDEAMAALLKKKSKFVESVDMADREVVKIKYAENPMFAESKIYRSSPQGGPRDISADIKLKDGRKVWIDSRPGMDWRYSVDGSISSTACGSANSKEEALKKLADALKEKGYDTQAITKELDNMLDNAYSYFSI